MSDEELKDALVNAAKYGWSKPPKDSEMRVKLERFLAEPEFRRRIEAVRPSWLTGEGNEHVGALHWSTWHVE